MPWLCMTTHAHKSYSPIHSRTFNFVADFGLAASSKVISWPAIIARKAQSPFIAMLASCSPALLVIFMRSSPVMCSVPQLRNFNLDSFNFSQ